MTYDAQNNAERVTIMQLSQWVTDRQRDVGHLSWRYPVLLVQ